MRDFLQKLRGAGAARPPRASGRAIALAAAGAFLAILVLAVVGAGTGTALLLGSFGASCVLVFGYPEAPFAQPLSVVVGHVLCAAIGLVVLQLCGDHAWSLGLAVALAVALMMATRTVHPPAGSNPVIVFLGHQGWTFLLFPVLAGAVLLVAIALVYNNVVRKTRYPSYW